MASHMHGFDDIGRAGAARSKPTPPKPPTPQDTWKVARGDNLWKIAKNCLSARGESTTNAAIRDEVNRIANLNRDLIPEGQEGIIQIGWELRLTARPEPAKTEEPQKPAAPPQDADSSLELELSFVSPFQPIALGPEGLLTYQPIIEIEIPPQVDEYVAAEWDGQTCDMDALDLDDAVFEIPIMFSMN